MIQQLFVNTVSALCYSLIDQRFPSDCTPLKFPHNSVVKFVLEEQNRMPDYLQFPLFLLTLIFDFWGLLRRGSFFHCQSPSSRQLQVKAWKNSPFQVCRDVMRFYESLVVLYWQSDSIHL
ncbi:hypothetical protein [Planktothrix mougeotii]|uniref:Transposase n=1 Tax=Planktothrix mougeotii LEGE 06226 TaxID=1828728 RepID=A0ABR9U7H6_9CYAN|nr:hypothetical protein [Planktothrix mougeotii]MBE9142419.1 hypothetical protein [Planktothrix mougeotii LEGE 06226]